MKETASPETEILDELEQEFDEEEVYVFPASFGQRRLWFLDQFEPGSPYYNIPTAFRLKGPLNLDIFKKAISEIIQRHESIRTTFSSIDGEVVQIISPELHLDPPVIDLTDKEAETREKEIIRLATEEARRPFDLAKGPLARITILKAAAQDHIVLLTMHHIISDGWSMGILVAEISVLYGSFTSGKPSPLPELPLQYADYAEWQKEYLQGEVLQKQLDYWKNHLDSNPPVLELPIDRNRPATQTNVGASVSITISKEITDGLNALGRKEGATLFMTLLSAFKTLLYRYTGQTDISVGTPIANRTRGEIEGLIGLFINTLVLRTQFDDNPSFRDLIKKTRTTTLDAYDHQDLPFEYLVDALQTDRNISYSPLFQVMFILQNAPVNMHKVADLRMEMIGVDMGSSTFDITLSIAESSAGLSASVEYNTDLFNRTTIERMLRCFKKLLSDVLANPDQNISQFPIIDSDERRQILFDWNRTKTDYPQDKLIHQMFEAQVKKTPEAIAVSAPAENGNNEITYAELNRRANQLAHYLQNNHVKPESIIAIYMERSLEMITALLGILKAGAAYLPIDLNHPEERITFMLEDAGVQTLLTQKSLAQRLPRHNVKTIFIDTEWDDISNQSADNPAAIAKADNLAYIIYTSGSTGKPKGVQIPNSSLTNYVYSAFDNFKMSSKDRVLQFASISFDTAAEEIYPCLCCGAALILRTENMISSPQIFLRMTGEWGVTLLDLPTAYWHQLMDEISAGNLKIPGTLRLVILGGERAVPEKVLDWQRQAGADVQLVNTYGPTEATIVATIWELPEASDKKPFDKEVPIGRPVANTQTYILDKHLNPVPVGAAGELHIGGGGLARGYLNRPELTSQCFISNPFSNDKNNRIYKTGDLARYLPGGNIEFLGRIDCQVKIRGFRIELGEIETLLRKHTAVKDAVLLAREDAPGEKRLTAYFITKENTEASADELRKYLNNELPDYMVPSAFMKLEKMPMTTSGKIDRRALPEPDQDQIMQELQAEYVAPRTPTEEVVASVFSRTLGIERVGAVHNFFELGGHSLMATQLISKLNKTFEIEIPLRSIFENPTVTGLALTVDTLKTAQAGLKIPEIKPVSRDLDLPLSFAQHRLWFLDQLEPNSPFYNLPETYRISGPLNVSILEDSINEIIRRHESLRTYFWTIDGSPIQKIEPEFRIGLPVIDISAMPEKDKESNVLHIAKERALQPISLDALPLFKLELIKISKNEHAVILIFHHIISDNWSSRILMSEMAAIYSAFSKGGLSPLPKLPIQYADFAYWQRNWLQGEVLEKQIDYWKKQLADSPPVLELPIDRPRPAMQTFNGSFKTFELSKKVSDGIKNLTKHEGATLFMTLLAAFQTLLYRYSGQDDISVGAPIANRNRAEIEGLIGFFVNTLVMRGDLSGNPGFRELIKRIRETALGAYAHQDLPFEKIVDAIQPERNMSHSPLFQVMFVLQNSAGTMQPAGRSELTLSPIEAHSNTAKFDLTLFMVEEGGNLGGALEYNTDLFDDSTITRMMDHFKRLLENIAADPDCGISNLTMISEKDKNQLLTDWNGVDKKHVLDQNVRRIFERQVEQTPHNIAVEFEGNKLTYRELNQRANQLAHYLQDLGVGADVLVGVSIERSIEMVIALLGILKAGGAYVPIDPSYPQERLAYILEDSQIAVLLTRKKLLDVLPEHKARAVCIDADWETIQKQSSENTIINIDPDNLAYMIYTSGSTGKPKGTLITQRGLTNYLNWAYSAYPLKEGRGSLVHSTIAFDATVTAVFTPLLTGKTITLIPDNADLEALANTLRKTGGFNLIKITPAHLDLLSQQIPANEAAGCAAAFIIGGENLTAEQISFWRENAPDTLLFNEYGPTETVVGCVVYEAAKWQGSGSVPIGKAIYNTRVYVLNEYMQPVPAGAAGELYIGGEGVARGYMNRPGLTAERFIPDPFSNKPGARLYKTGDLVRYLKDGIMEFIGRVDNQVKIRGYRIELAEIETVLIRNEQINDCVVLAREDIPGDRRLVAYYITEGQADPSITELRNFLKEELPEYMIPAAFVMLDEFPLTPNGKVDRKALPQPDFSRPDLESEFVAPRTEDEKRLAEIWMNILNIEKVGIHDNFFELGGHSLIATQFIARIRDAFGVELPLRALFETPTIIGLIHEIDQARLADILPAPPPLVKVPRDGDIPVSFTQQRLWFLDQLSPNNSFYNLPTAMRLIGKLDVDILEKTIQEIIRRHEILHTTFAYKDGQPVQVVDPDFKFELDVTDLTSLSEEDREKTARDMATEEAREAFDLELGPLLRVNLIKMAQDDYVILYTMHHIISDGWSVNILMREVAALYENFSKGLPSPLPELAVQFADYAVWQRGWLTDELLQKQISYWKETIGINPPALHLPTDRQRPAIQTFKGNTQSGFIPKELGDELQRLGGKEGATLFMTLLAAFQTLLYRYSRQEEFLLGSPIASRNHIETEALIGFFVNTLVLKADFSEDPNFMTLLKIVRETTLGAFAHQDLPFEQLVEILQPERDMSHSPLFQVMFVLQNTPPPRGIALSDIKIEPVKARDNTAKFDLSFVIMESGRGFATEFEYNTDLFDKSTIIRMQEHFVTLLEQIVEHPDQPLSTLPLMKLEKAKELLLDWNQTQVDFPDNKCIHELFENQVNKTPGAAALVYEDQELTYGELNQRANQLANYLRQSGVDSEKIVGISLDRSIEMVVGLLGILKAGGVYLPIDPAYPEERIAYIIEDTNIDILLTQQALLHKLPTDNIKSICLDTDWREIAKQPDNNPVNITLPQNLAYIIYTSGSTGRPKGTMLQHRGLCNLTRSLHKNYKVDKGRRCLQFASFSFDASVEEIFTALTNGAALHLINRETLLSGTGLIDTLKNNKITNVTLPPSVLNVIAENEFPDLATVVSAGESCPPDITKHWAPNRHFVNGYGPTENTVCTTVYNVAETVKGSHVPIGKPIDNVQVYILDKNMNIMPIGVPGELHISGAGLARGYFNQPALTADKFIPNPFNDEAGGRLYKTGDLARCLPDGNIDFLGRIDQQVKVRGFRIELGEIEAVLKDNPSVQNAVVTAKKITPGDSRLIAYLVPAADHKIDVDEIKNNLKKQLPDYMTPSALMVLETLPLTPNGKVDRRALPEPEKIEGETEKVYVKPTNTIEVRLVQIWEELLGVRPVGIKDNFFDLGGHSLLAMRLLTQVEQQFKKDIQLVDLFQQPTIEHLAAILAEDAPTETTAKLVEMKKGGSLPPMYFVHPSGGSVHFYSELVKYLDPEQPFYGIQAKGLGGKEELHQTIEAMASAYVELILENQPQGPYYLGSYSFGVIVVYEMAQQLKVLGHEVGMLAQFDQGPAVAHEIYKDDAEMLSDLFHRYFKVDPDYLRTLESDDQFRYVLKKAKKAKLLPRFIRMIEFKRFTLINQTQIQAWSKYNPKPYEDKLILFRSEENKNASEPDLGWGRLVKGQVEIIDTPGDHLSMLHEPYVQTLAKKLNEQAGKK